MKNDKVWSCKIGGPGFELPPGADLPMRLAVEAAFEKLTGKEARACFSGWGQEWTDAEIRSMTPPDVTPLTPAEHREFLKAGVVFEGKCTHKSAGKCDCHPVRGSDGGYITDAKQGAAELRFLAKYGIWNPLKAQPNHNCVSVGLVTLGDRAGKWCGWSHRAFSMFDTREEAAAFAEIVS